MSSKITTSYREKVSLFIISGRSGSGKSVVLRALEDLGFYCIDNLPVMFVSDLLKTAKDRYPKLAVSIDIRNIPQNGENLSDLYDTLRADPLIDITIIYIDAEDKVLIKRYLETRRLHPLSRNKLSLEEAIVMEKALLSDIAATADLRIDTSTSTIHELTNQVTTLILGRPQKELVIVFESFGFKSGIVNDADFVFDARFLPNPYWETELRDKTGLDPEVISFFRRHAMVDRYTRQIDMLLMEWLEELRKSNRSYLTVAIGCTGGYHRSVYIAQSLFESFSARGIHAKVRHRALEKSLD